MAVMFNVDRHIAIQSGWIAGPAFGVAMMAAPDYLKLEPPYSGLLFWGGIGVFLLTIMIVIIISLHEEKRRKAVLGPIILMATGALIICGGASWYFWPTKHATEEASKEVTKASIPELEDFFVKDFNFLSLDRTLSIRVQNPSNGLDTTIDVKLRIFQDFSSNSEFVSAFIPFFGDARLMQETGSFIENLKDDIKKNHQELKSSIGIGSKVPGTSIVYSNELVFSGRVFIYTLNTLDAIQMGSLVALYRKDGMFLEIRGSDYLFFRSKS
jgi:hypothetical protein